MTTKAKPTRANGRGLYKRVLGLKKDECLRDPEYPAIRYVCRQTAQGLRQYGQLRYKHPVTGKWTTEGCGAVPVPTEVEAMADALMAEAATERPEGVLIFKWDDLAFEKIRRKAHDIMRLVHSGADPRGVVGPAGVTVEQAIERHIKEPRAKPLEESTVAYYGKVLRLYLAKWAKVPLRRLDQSAVMAMRGEIQEAHGHSTAVMAMRVLKAAWGSGQFHDSRLQDFPKMPRGVLAGNPPKEGSLKRSYLPTWFKELEAVGGQRADVWLLGMMTGLRHGDLVSIRREHIKGCVLTIPDPKGGTSRAFELPLSDAACQLVKRVLASHKSEWLWPSSKGSKSGHIEDPEPQPSEFSVKWTMHDLRRAYAGVAGAVMMNEFHLQLLLNHKIRRGSVTAGHVGVLEAEDLRPSQQAVTDRLQKLGLRV